jgi:predicted amidohydrolase
MAERKVRVAIVQAAPLFLDLDKSVEKAIRLTGEAARKGARLVAFGETWLPGYPAWLDLCPGSAYWDHAPAKKAYARLVENSAVIPGPETDRLCAAARENGVVLVIGIHERVAGGPGHGTLYNTNLVIGPDGAILSRHRKLVPTHAERLVWGPGNGDGLEAVTTPAGRVGSLICWEHWMPLARFAMHAKGEQIHVAAWPEVPDIHHLASRHYAFEGRCYVICVGSYMRTSDLPADFELAEAMGAAGEFGGEAAELLPGGSGIIGPDGAWIAGPVSGREEIVYGEIDLGRIAEEQQALDSAGHYNRPDVFSLTVDERPRRQVSWIRAEVPPELRAGDAL